MEQRDSANPAPFNFSHLENRTLDYLAKVRSEADKIISSAQEEIALLRSETEKTLTIRNDEYHHRLTELVRREKELVAQLTTFSAEKQLFLEQTLEESKQEGFDHGYEEGKNKGYQTGWELATKDAVTQREEEVRRQLREHSEGLIPTMDRFVSGMSGVRQALLKRWEDNLLQIAGTIAWQVMAHELPQMKEVPLALLREALELAIGCTSLKIRMNSHDVENLKESINLLLQEMGVIAKAEIIPDSRMQPGGCLVETSVGLIDQRLESRLKRILSELS